MGYVALKHLNWGDGMIAPGEPVPDEEGRNYASLLRSGRIAEVKETEQMSDEELAAAYEKVKAERDELEAKVEELTAPVQVPGDVTPGETPGWPVDSEGNAVALPDETREWLAELVTVADTLRERLEELETADPQAPESGGGESTDPAPETETDEAKPSAEPASTGVDLPDGVVAEGGGWYRLPNGEKVRGRKALEKALAEPQAPESGGGE